MSSDKRGIAVAYRSVGSNQTWQDVTASRALTTAYQNTTGRPIMANIWCNRANVSSRATLQTSPDNSVWTTAAYYGSNMTSTGASDLTTGTMIVPPGFYYRVTVDGAQSLSGWSELR